MAETDKTGAHASGPHKRALATGLSVSSISQKHTPEMMASPRFGQRSLNSSHTQIGDEPKTPEKTRADVSESRPEPWFTSGQTPDSFKEVKGYKATPPTVLPSTPTNNQPSDYPLSGDGPKTPLGCSTDLTTSNIPQHKPSNSVSLSPEGLMQPLGPSPNGVLNGPSPNGVLNGSSPNGVLNGPSPSIGSINGLLSSTFAYNNHNESIYDDMRYFPSLDCDTEGVVKFDPKDPESICLATLKALVVQLTSPEVIDYNLICDFFLTYRSFTDSRSVLDLLLTRLIWAFQYIHLRRQDTEDIGRLALVRTFVVLRHWILNYFYDDFLSDAQLCDTFAARLNSIADGLVLPQMTLEAKIITDLKTHWLSQINEFHGRTYALTPPSLVYATALPMLAEYISYRLVKSATDASIHTNPSFRRSAMLSLYDTRAHHKCIVYQDDLQDLVPLTTLVQQHKSLRTSLNDRLRDFHPKKVPPKPLAPRHNHMNLDDSSLALKRTTVPEKKQADPKVASGFSTNGQIKLPSAKIFHIVPISPVKKMDVFLKDQHAAANDDMGRKKSIKKLLGEWTKSLSPDMKQETVGKFVEEEPIVHTIGKRVDVLSARIIDELEFIIRHYIHEQAPPRDEIRRSSIDIAMKHETAPPNTIVRSTSDEIQDYSELNIEKIDNLFSQNTFANNSEDLLRGNNELKRLSFRPVASINWSDEKNLFLDNSGLLERKDSRPCRLSSLEYDSSDLEHFNEEVADLDIAMSPQSKKKTLHRISLSEHFARRVSGQLRELALSTRQESVKSYMSYDSAFSVLSEFKQDPFFHSNLKKKTGCNNLRDLMEELPAKKRVSSRLNRTSAHSHILKSSSFKQTARISTLCALTELPFSDFESDIAQRDRLSGYSHNSIFSHDRREKLRTSNALDDLDSSVGSVAIPGISNVILKQLAAIPDETFTKKNPIECALYRLEGRTLPPSKHRYSLASQISLGNRVVVVPAREETSKSMTAIAKNSRADADKAKANLTTNTEQILEEINNAVTEDAIGYSSDIESELRKKPVTPIKTKIRLMIRANSTPTINLLRNISASDTSARSKVSPKAVLETYQLSSSLSVRSILAEDSHVSFILSYGSRAIAEHFTIIERDMLQDIDWKELIELQWNKDLTPINSWLEIIVNEELYNKNKGVNLVIARFNLMVNWVISEILLTKSEEERIDIISRLIHVAYHSYEMQNYATLMQVILALTSEKVNMLKSAWQRLTPGDILTLKHLEQLTSPIKNFVNLRLCINQINPSKGCLPFVGLYLLDLIFNAERPRYAKESDCEKTLGDSTLGSDSGDKLINFSRFRTAVHIVKLLLQSIEWLQNYDFDIDEELLRKCLYIKSLDESEMNFCAQQAKARDANAC